MKALRARALALILNCVRTCFADPSFGSMSSPFGAKEDTAALLTDAQASAEQQQCMEDNDLVYPTITQVLVINLRESSQRREYMAGMLRKKSLAFEMMLVDRPTEQQYSSGRSQSDLQPMQ
jgi:hypothetical protein